MTLKLGRETWACQDIHLDQQDARCNDSAPVVTESEASIGPHAGVPPEGKAAIEPIAESRENLRKLQVMAISIAIDPNRSVKIRYGPRRQKVLILPRN
jgi:hypothetical protein